MCSVRRPSPYPLVPVRLALIARFGRADRLVNFERGLSMSALITDVVAGLIMYGDFIASGYVPAEEQSGNGEKVYVQITAPNLQSHKIRLTDAAYAQMCEVDFHMGAPVMLEVRPMVFRDTQYWRGESFYVRPDGRRPLWPTAKPVSEAVPGSNGAPSASASKSAGSAGGKS